MPVAAASKLFRRDPSCPTSNRRQPPIGERPDGRLEKLPRGRETRHVEPSRGSVVSGRRPAHPPSPVHRCCSREYSPHFSDATNTPLCRVCRLPPNGKLGKRIGGIGNLDNIKPHPYHHWKLVPADYPERHGESKSAPAVPGPCGVPKWRTSLREQSPVILPPTREERTAPLPCCGHQPPNQLPAKRMYQSLEMANSAAVRGRW